jgi:hypothetical protein
MLSLVEIQTTTLTDLESGFTDLESGFIAQCKFCFNGEALSYIFLALISDKGEGRF